MLKKRLLNKLLPQIVLAVVLLGLFLGFMALRQSSPLKAPRIVASSVISNSLFFASNREFSVYLGERNTNRPVITYSLPTGNKISFSYRDIKGKLLAPETTENTIIFKDVSPNLDIKYTTLPTGLKEEIILKKQATNNIFFFDLNTSNAYPQNQTDTLFSGIFTDKKGKYLFHFEKPYAIDANGQRTDNVSVQIKQSPKNNSLSLELAVDYDWLTSKDRVYPIIVDPTILHDESSDFVYGQLNRVKNNGSDSAPYLESYFQELSTDINTIALWHLNESSGNALDSSGNGYTGTPTGTTIIDGQLGKARLFNGTSDFIDATNITSLNALTSMTASMWFRETALATNMALIAKWDYQTQGSFGIQTGSATSSEIAVYIASAINEAGLNYCNTSGANIVAGQWYHLGVVFNGISTGNSNRLKVYINGKEVACTFTGTIPAVLTTATSTVKIGKFGGTLTRYFNGSIDEIKISRIARTPEEIRLEASRRPYSVFSSDSIDLTHVIGWNSFKWGSFGNATGNAETATASATSALVAQWHFNETSGTTIDNSAGATSCGGTDSNCDLTLGGLPDSTGQDIDAGVGLTANNLRWGAGALETRSSTSSLLHADGANNSTVFFDDTIKTWTPAGNTVISTTSPKYGTGSMYFPGTSDTLTTAASVDFYFSTLPFTIDFWIKSTQTSPSYGGILSPNATYTGTNAWLIFNNVGTLGFWQGSTQAVTAANGTWNDGNWHHVAITRYQGSLRLFLDGTQQGSTYTTGVAAYVYGSSTVGLLMGTQYGYTGTRDFLGYIDELRITRGIALWTANFTPPAASYYASLSDPASNALDPSSSFSIETWVNITRSNTPIINNNNNNGTACTHDGYYLGVDSTGYPIFNVDTNGATAGCEASVTGDTLINDSKWHHLVATFDQGASSAKIYLDGMFIGEDTSISSSITSVTGSIYFASTNSTIDTTRFYSRALTPSEVISNYNSSRVELQTRIGDSPDPNDGTWEAWKTITGETQILSLDADQSNWSWDLTSTYMPKSQADESNIIAEGSGSLKLTTGIPQVDANTVALYHLDETSGTGAYFHDSSTNANHGTPTGTTIVEGVSNKARLFDDTDDKISISDHSSLDLSTNGTIEAWIKTNANEANNWFLCKTGNYCLGVNATGALLFTGASAQDNAGTSLLAGTWHHVAVTNNNTTATYYVDGAVAGTDAVAWGSTLTNGVSIGSDGSTNYFDGIIDEVRISNSVRTAEAIAEAYRAGRDHRLSRTITSTDLSSSTKLPFYIASDRLGSFSQLTLGESAFANYEPDTDTIGFWHLDEKSGSGAYLLDMSGNSRNGTPTGTTHTEGIIGKAQNFVAGSDISLGNISMVDSLANLTVDAWIYPSLQAAATHYRVFSEQNVLYVGQYANQITFYMGNGSSFTLQDFSGGTLNLNQWNYVAWVKSGTSYYIYLNGQVIKSGTAAPATLGTSTNVNYISTYDGTNQPWRGDIDEFRISNVARSANEIRQAYEIGARTHNITIDFKAKLDSGDLITGSTDLGFTIDETAYGATLPAGHLFLEDKIIIKENVDGTEYIAQGTVNSISASTGVGTVDAWDTGSTFPTGGFTVDATVFKWQREFFDITGSLASHKNATIKLTYRITDGSLASNIYLDDIRSSTGYLTNPFGSTITSSTGSQYFQYKAILSQNSFNATSSALTSVSLDYDHNQPPNLPSLDAPTDTATGQLFLPVLKTTATDNDATDVLKYEITLCTDSDMSVDCQFFNQTTESTGWSAASYTQGVQAVYTLQTALVPNTVYYWKSMAIDELGSNNWSATQTAPYSFTTNQTPEIPTLDFPSDSAVGVPLLAVLKTTAADGNTSDVLKYKITLCTDPAMSVACQTFNQTTEPTGWSAASYTQGVQAVYTLQTALVPNTVYYWKSMAIDELGSNIWSATQTTPYSFTTNEPPNTPSLDLPVDTAIDQSTLPILKTTGTDDNTSDVLKYKITLCTDLAMTEACQTFNQTEEPTGWSAASYTQGVQAVYTVQTALAIDTTYYWKSMTIDEAGSNTWSATQTTPYSFTTNKSPNVPTLDLPTDSDTEVTVTPIIKTTADDDEGNDLKYKITICTDWGMSANCQIYDQTAEPTGWSAASYASGVQAVYTVQTALNPSTTYYWKSMAIDESGSSAWGDTQTTPYSFSTITKPIKPSLCTLSKEIDNSSITVTWIDNSTVEENYQIWKVTDGGLPSQLGSNLPADTTQVIDSAVAETHSYAYLIRALFYDGANAIYSDWCSTQTSYLSSGYFSLDGLKLDGINID